MRVKVINKSKHPLPQYETIASAGMDVRANIDQAITLPPLGRSLVKTGLFVEISIGYEIQVRPRSGLAFKKGITQMPILDASGKVKELIQKEEMIKRFKSSISSVVIMAGGKGKRLLPHTSNCPKPMIAINGKPMLEIIIEKCINFGFDNFYISVNYLKDQIINYFDNGNKWGIKIKYLYEEQPLGTAGSLALIPKDENLHSSILVLNGDIITNLDLALLAEFHEKHDADMTIAAKISSYKIPYGVINTSGLELERIVEKPTYNFLVSAGIYIVKPFILKYIKKNTFFDMPDLVSVVKENNSKIVTFPIHEYWLDVGRPETLEQISKEWPLK